MPEERIQNGSEYIKDSRNTKCNDNECVTCGHPVTLYGYRDPEDDYNGLVEDTMDDKDNGSYDTETTHRQIADDFNKGYDNNEDGAYEGIHEDDNNYYLLDQPSQPQQNKVRFDENPHVIVYNSPEPDNNKSSDNVLEHMDLVEHMDNQSVGALIGLLCGHLCILLIAICIAKARGELECVPGSDNYNVSLIMCILLFPQLYFIYALVEWLTRPGACRI
jgi:hypothetical protein